DCVFVLHHDVATQVASDRDGPSWPAFPNIGETAPPEPGHNRPQWRNPAEHELSQPHHPRLSSPAEGGLEDRCRLDRIRRVASPAGAEARPIESLDELRGQDPLHLFPYLRRQTPSLKVGGHLCPAR